MSSRLGSFTSKSNKYFTSWPTQPQVLKASKYGLAAQMISFANVSLNPTQGSNLDSLKSHKERLGRTSQVLSRLRDGSGI